MGILGGILSAVGDIANVGANVAGTISEIKTNDLNYKLAKENLDYQKQLQKTIFSREDSSVQRRVEDLKRAGLSPTLAAGSGAGTGSVVSTSAPKKESNMEALAHLATVKTLLAQQQKAQTEADIARQKLEQDKMDTDYFRSVGVSPVQSKMGWKQTLTNMFAGFFNPDSKIRNALTDMFGNVGNYFTELTNSIIGSRTGAKYNPDGSVESHNGSTITSGQVSLLKQKGLYQEFLQNGLTDRVVKALGGKR